jgi:hypothetical protein
MQLRVDDQHQSRRLPHRQISNLSELDLSTIDVRTITPEEWEAVVCLGLHFAYMQAKCFFYHLLTSTRVSVEPGYSPHWQMWRISKSLDGLPIRLERSN